MGFAVYRGQSAWDLWSTKSIPRWICGLQRTVRVRFVVYEGQFAWDLRSTEGTKIQMCFKYVEMVLFLSWTNHGSNPGGGKTLFSSPKGPDRL